jgi:hypothetical protein
MIVVVEGTKSFNDYEIFMRAMAVALSTPSIDNEIQIWSLGPHTVNGYTAAFSNSSENYLRQKGFKISFHKVNIQWVEENIQFVDYYAFFSKPNERLSKLASKVKDTEVELGIFRY